jgi:hypothetical protein
MTNPGRHHQHNPKIIGTIQDQADRFRRWPAFRTGEDFKAQTTAVLSIIEVGPSGFHQPQDVGMTRQVAGPPGHPCQPLAAPQIACVQVEPLDECDIAERAGYLQFV